MQQLRLAELIGALSHALDMTEGQPVGHCLRCAYIGMRIAREIDLGTSILLGGGEMQSGGRGKAAILGDACYKVIWDAETKQVRISAPDIQGIYTWWVGDDERYGKRLTSPGLRLAA